VKNYRDGYEALTEMCGGFGSQEIAHHLIEVDGIWKGKSLDTGAARVRACLNKDKAEFFKLSELIAVSKFTKHYDAIFFMCNELELSVPQPVSVEEQLANISRGINDAANFLAHATQHLSRIEQGRDEVYYEDSEKIVNFSRENIESLMP